MSTARLELLLAEFCRWGYNVRGWGPATQKKYEWRARSLEKWLQENRKKSILWATARDLQAWLFSTPANATTRNHYRQAVVALYAFLQEHEYVETNHALQLPRLPQPTPLPKALTAAQAHAVEQAAKLFDKPVRCLVLLYLYVGLRKTEARLLEWPSLDIEGGWVRFTAKGRKERVRPLLPKVCKVLRVWREECPDPRWVFPSDYGKLRGRPRSETWVRNTIRAVGVAAGLPDLHPHVLRHTFATRLLEKGAHVRQVQELLGHASLQTTQIYLSVRPVNLKDAVEGLDYGP